MSEVGLLIAGRAGAVLRVACRAACMAGCTAVLAGALSGCSEGLEQMPVQADLAPMAPVAAAQPEEIVVPMPVPAQLPPFPELRTAHRGGLLKTGRPYEVAGRWYFPSAGSGYDEEGLASWYGPDFQGKTTANGETYNMNRLTAAHPTLPMPCYVAVTNADNGRTVVVRVNDRGPYKAGRIIDLSRRAARLLGVTRYGTANVRVKYLKMAHLLADQRFEEAYLEQQPWYRASQTTEGSAQTMPAVWLTRSNGPVLASPHLRPALAGWQSDVATGQ